MNPGGQCAGAPAGLLSFAFLGESDAHARLSENDLVAGLEADATRTTRHRERSSASNDAPSWNVTPERSVQVQVVSSVFGSHFSAKAGMAATPPIS